VERLRSSWTSTADLEETIAAMFHVSPGELKEGPGGAPVLEEAIEKKAVPSGAIVSDESPHPVALDSAATVVDAKPDETIADDPTHTVSGDSSATVVVDRPPSGDLTTTIADPPTDTVVSEQPEPSATVSVAKPGTVAALPKDTVAGSTAAPLLAGLTNGLWYTEGKPGVFATSRVRRIQRAQDALTHAEESVYDVLWGPKNQNKDAHRFASMGYDAIAKAARVTKMNAKFIVERLIFKGFARVESLADPLRRIPTKYCIFSYRTALDNMFRCNRHYVVRTGNGVLFAHPLSPTETVIFDSTDTDKSGTAATVADRQPATGTPVQSATVSASQTDTVAVAGTLLDSTSFKAQAPPPMPRQWPIAIRALLDAFGHGDDDAVRLMAEAALRHAADATDQELAYFIREEAPRIRGNRSLDNPMGLLIRQVPRRFAGESFRIYRETQLRQKQAEIALRQERVAEATRVLLDPDSSPLDRQWAQIILDEGGEQEQE
jgi:hypothetical protein